jgi:anti-sigma regulatory factor (Ser/Thr protein kinase)
MSFPKAELRAKLPSTLESVENFCAQFRLWRPAVWPSSDRFAAELLLREAMTNSVEHGCCGDPNRQILCVVRAKKAHLVIAVQDEGQGFDWRAAMHLRAASAATSGRGIEILRSYADRVHFNVKGNAVTLIRRLSGVASRT